MNDGRTIWRCEKDHLDDFHFDMPENQLCSRCGGRVEAYVPLPPPGEAVERAARAHWDCERRDEDWRPWNDLPDDIRDFLRRKMSAALSSVGLIPE